MKRLLIVCSAVGLTACATVIDSLPANEYAGYRWSDPHEGGIRNSYFGVRDVFGSNGYADSRERAYQKNALANDREYPLSFAGMLSRPRAGGPDIDLSGNWREVGDRAVRIVNRYSYDDIKAAMARQPAKAVVAFSPPPENQASMVNTEVCNEKLERVLEYRNSVVAFGRQEDRHINPQLAVASHPVCQDILRKQSFDLEKAAGNSLVSKILAGQKYAWNLRAYGGFSQGNLRWAGEKEKLETQKEVMESTKRYMAMAVLFRAYEDATSAKDVVERPSNAQPKEELNKHGVAELVIHQQVPPSVSDFVFKVAGNPWFGQLSTASLSRKDFAKRICEMIPMDYTTIGHLFGDKDMLPLKYVDITKGGDGTFFSDPLKFGVHEYHLILSPEREFGFAGERVDGSAAYCVEDFKGRLLKDDAFKHLSGRTYILGSQKRGTIPHRLDKPRPSFDKSEHAALVNYVQAHLDQHEKLRTAHKLR